MLKEFQFVMSLKNWRSIADTISHALIPKTSYIYYHSNLRVHIDIKVTSSRRHSASYLAQ